MDTAKAMVNKLDTITYESSLHHKHYINKYLIIIFKDFTLLIYYFLR